MPAEWSIQAQSGLGRPGVGTDQLPGHGTARAVGTTLLVGTSGEKTAATPSPR